MTDLGKGVAVDFPEKPSVFLIKGYGEIRIQKGDTRINGVTKDQLEIIVRRLEDGQKSDITDAKQAAPRKIRATRRRSSKS